MTWFWAVDSFLNVQVLPPLPTYFAPSFCGWVELVGLEVCGELGPPRAGRGPGSGSGGLANRSGPQSGSFDHGSMVTWNLYLYVDDYYQCEIYLRNGTNVLPCSRLRPTITCFSRKRQNSNSFAFNATGLENSDRYLITPKK